MFDLTCSTAKRCTRGADDVGWISVLGLPWPWRLHQGACHVMHAYIMHRCYGMPEKRCEIRGATSVS